MLMQIGNFAKENDCKISIIGIEGADITMSAIKQAAAITSGTVNILHPIELIRQVAVVACLKLIKHYTRVYP